MYVVMDGFDLGIGIIFPFVPDSRDRDVMMNTVAPVWDGNETWLVLGGAGLFAAFPLAYSVVLSALYLPIIFMLIGLIFRGVAFEFRFKASEEQQHLWDKAFIGGSLLATFSQGVVLGAFIDGLPVVDRTYAGGALDWLTPFSVFCGLALIVAYALLGCTWLMIKTSGALLQRMHDLGTPLVWAVLVVTGIVSVWTPLAHEEIAARWFSLPNLFWFLPVPILVLLCTYALLRAIFADLGADLPRLQWLGYQSVAKYHSAVGEYLGRRRLAEKPGLHAGWRAVHHSADSGLHRVELLRVPRQSHPGERLSLSIRDQGV
jgi:cytochrome d ubiquinol oxidase subunit II